MPFSRQKVEARGLMKLVIPLKALFRIRILSLPQIFHLPKQITILSLTTGQGETANHLTESREYN